MHGKIVFERHLIDVDVSYRQQNFAENVLRKRADERCLFVEKKISKTQLFVIIRKYGFDIDFKLRQYKIVEPRNDISSFGFLNK